MVADTMVLTEYRDLLPDFVLWAHLPEGLEEAYWRSSSTRQDVLTTDAAGLVAFLIGRVFLHGYATFKHGHCQAWHISNSIHLILSILQLIWMNNHPSSYLQHRTWVNMFHRVRNWAEWWIAESTPLGEFSHPVYPPPGSWTAGLTFATQRSLLKAVAQLNHPLPVTPLLLVSSMSLLNAMLFGPPFVRFIIPEYQLHDKSQQFCHAFHSVLTLPWSLVDRITGSRAELLHCAPGYIEYVLVFVLCYQIVILLPLGPTFVMERASKAAFINSLGPRKPQWATQLLRRYRPSSWSDMLLSAWLWLSLPWMAVVLACRLIAAS